MYHRKLFPCLRFLMLRFSLLAGADWRICRVFVSAKRQRGGVGVPSQVVPSLTLRVPIEPKCATSKPTLRVPIEAQITTSILTLRVENVIHVRAGG